MFHWLLLLHLISTWYMVGLISLTEICHYPLFDKIPVEVFPGFHQSHIKRIRFAVMPAMTIELLSGVVLVLLSRSPDLSWSLWINLALLSATWWVTCFWSARCHEQFIKHGFSEAIQISLMRSNHLRTLVWWIRAVLLTIAVSNAVFVIA